MKFKILATLVLFGAVLSSCHDRMTYKENTDYGKEDLENHYKNVMGLVSDLYGMMDYDFGNNYSGAMMASATDESQYAWSGNAIEDFYNGSWSPANPKSAMWNTSYKAIQACNFYLENFLGLDFSDLKYNDDYAAKMFRYENSENEVRFFRAYFYFCLVRQYGDVPFYTTVMTPDVVNTLTRTPAQTVLKFIADECDAIAPNIPLDYSDLGNLALPDIAETGRASKYAVLALKGRALLYAASPLLNTTNDSELWNQAAKANKAVIDLCETNGKVLGDYTDIWGANSFNATEALFVRRVKADYNDIEKWNYPVGVVGGGSGNCPTQTMVDAYQTTSGNFRILADGTYDATTPYAGLDPRFEATIVRNGEVWPTYTNAYAIEPYEGGRNGRPIAGATPTGYYLSKLLDGALNLGANPAGNSRHSWLTFRLGEFYLNYAEAVFKYLGSADATSADFPMSAREAASVTRNRVGMPDLPAGLSPADFWDRYTNERMVELAFEGHRFWDIRRWKEGDKFKSVDVMEITPNGNGTYDYTRKTITRMWDDKMYLFPIPQSERLKNPNLGQNPGWVS